MEAIHNWMENGSVKNDASAVSTEKRGAHFSLLFRHFPAHGKIRSHHLKIVAKNGEFTS